MSIKSFSFLFIFFGLQAAAQQTDSLTAKKAPFELTATVDGYYRYNFHAPQGVYNNFSRFTGSQNSFELGMASVGAQHRYKKVGAVIDIGYGRRAEELNYTDGDHPSLFAVKQAFITYLPSDRLTFTFGKFFSNTGYERVDAYKNEQYSTSYLFAFGPLFFTGVKAEYRVIGRTYLMAGIANPADFSTTTSSVKTGIARIRTSNRTGRLQAQVDYTGYSGLGTPRLLAPNYLLYKSLNQFDITVRDSVGSKFTAGFTGRISAIDDGDVRKYGGAALFLTYWPSQKAGVHLRTEYLTDKNDIKIGGKVWEATLSGDFRIDEHLRLIPELRYDKSDLKIFQNNDYLGRDKTMTALFAAVYLF